ncbi:hypothetical protein PAXRUDRAFT_172877 [Paxillus rubicundulus Ve08.2h10]|uniref:Uncharacterized protein n=1 Tax=Paxillus rubicundulus Ve08.2h10 TaxID=930991 RepID=A0A0D0CJT4_9AGAM|nr:hypothetical protein PAXRUDRAFT_172877 [Paxillus rubicundulus Ve08.2h10]
MGFSVALPSVLHIDKQSAAQVAKHPEHHGCMDPLDFFFPTAEMPADLLTKALAHVKVQEFCHLLGLAPLGGS